MGQMLGKFSQWVYAQKDMIPKHDHVQLEFNTDTIQGGGLAWVSAICQSSTDTQKELGVSISNDNGAWTHVTSMAHELGHK